MIKNLYKNKLAKASTNGLTRESKLNLKNKTQEGILNFNPAKEIKKRSNPYFLEVGNQNQNNDKKKINKLKDMKFKNAE